MLDCHFKKLTGSDCPGCGAQRSLVSLIDGNFTESVLLFPALIPLLFTLLYLTLHLIFKFKHGARVIVISFSITASLMLINFIFKLISG